MSKNHDFGLVSSIVWTFFGFLFARVPFRAAVIESEGAFDLNEGGAKRRRGCKIP